MTRQQVGFGDPANMRSSPQRSSPNPRSATAPSVLHHRGGARTTGGSQACAPITHTIGRRAPSQEGFSGDSAGAVPAFRTPFKAGGRAEVSTPRDAAALRPIRSAWKAVTA